MTPQPPKGGVKFLERHLTLKMKLAQLTKKVVVLPNSPFRGLGAYKAFSMT